MMSPYWFTKSSVLILLTVGSFLALWIVFGLCRWFRAWRRQRRIIANSPWREEIGWGFIESYVDELRKQAAPGYYECPCLVLVWRSRLEFLPSARFSCGYRNEFGTIQLKDLNERLDAERWQCYRNRMIAYSKDEPTFMADLALTMILQGYPVKEIPKERNNAMRKHTENAKAEEVTTEPENEVQQDATVSETAETAGDIKTAGPEHPVDLKAGLPEPAEPQAGPVNVADLQPGRDVDPLLGDKADVLQFLSQLTQAIEGAGIINGKYVQNQFTDFAIRLLAIEQAVKQNTKQTRALIVQLKEEAKGE